MSWTGIKDAASEDSKGSGEQVFGNWRKEDTCSIMTESLAQLFPVIVWKAELVSDKPSHLRVFPSTVLKVPLGFFMPLRLKHVKKEIN